jgi:HSP20 family protein
MHTKHSRAEGFTGWNPAFEKGRFEGRGGHPHFAHPHFAYPRFAHPHFAHHRAPVSIYKTENTYEVLVFAPGRAKENFKVKLSAGQLVVGYQPTEETSSLDWVRKEYSRGGFERRFLVDESIETEDIEARYEDGVLKLTLKIKPGSVTPTREVTIN